jgi:hypothetical protein
VLGRDNQTYQLFSKGGVYRWVNYLGQIKHHQMLGILFVSLGAISDIQLYLYLELILSV